MLCRPGRALAPLPRLLAYAAPFLLPGGLCLFHKGANTPAELAAAAQEWSFHTERHADPATPGSIILALRDVRHA